MVTSHTWAQSNAPPKQLSIQNPGIQDVEDPDNTRSISFLKGVTYVGNGYYVKSVVKEFATVVDEIGLAATKKTEFSTFNEGRDCRLGHGFEYVNRLDEGKFRVTYLFKRSESSSIMLTVTDVKRSGAKHSFPKYLATHVPEVGYVVTVLAVPIGAAKQRAIWKSSWHTANLFFDFYVETTLKPPLEIEYSFVQLMEAIRSVRCSWSN